MANREIPGQGGSGLVVIDSNYQVRSSLEGATLVCRAAVPITVSLLSFIVPGIDYYVVNRAAPTVTVVSAVGELFVDGGAPQASITVRQNESVHVIYDVQLRQWQVERAAGVDQILIDIDALKAADRLQALSSMLPGFVTEFRITEPNYPYAANQNVDFRLQRLDATTLRCLATGPLYFPSGAYSNDGISVVTLPQTDIPLSSVNVGPADGMFVRYAGIQRNGAIVFSADGLARSKDTIQLGVIILRRIAGVNSFLDELVNSPVRTQPNLACIDNFLRTLAPLTTGVQVAPNGANLNMLSRNGFIYGESINWGDENNAHEVLRPGNAITSFYRVSAGTLTQTTLGGVFTLIDPSRYWNGSALVLLAAGMSSVQRVLLTPTGGVLVQFGEAQYANLEDAEDAIYSTAFTDVLPKTFAIEIARIAMTYNASALNNNAQAIWVSTGSRY